ncbi:Dna ligase [Thalictrum thalictroides]|uniref:DNA ligase n=1 Tax=Thalictrum thalictroides TaxID=46969 RepID=A0A7J6V979_THATH|nr:Dna ligase [Thalictrum thalictroides]
MASLSPSSSISKTLNRTLDSSSIYLKSYDSYSEQFTLQPHLSFTLLSQQSPLPSIPTDLPQPKLIPKTRFIVDGFRYSGNYSVSYFLSHFHSDHYVGLSSNWSKGIIFCSKVTAQLLIDVLKVSPLFVVGLRICETVCIDGCEVTLIDANHCPGAVQFLLKIPDENGKYKRYVHTGDFRFSNSMKFEPLVKEFVGADLVFLDTTYCNPKFVFPAQVDSINYIVDTIVRIRNENQGSEKNVLFLIATYVIGKEKILLEISKRCGCMIHVDNKKSGILGVLGFGKSETFTEDASVTDVHVVGWNVLGETWPYFRPNFNKMTEIMFERGYSRVVGFVPTGWMYKVKKDGFAVRTKDSLEIHLVPYSEHSSYDELREYVRFLKPKRVIPTVGMDVEKLDGKHAIAMQKHFAGLVDEMANKTEFIRVFHRRSLKTDKKGKDDDSSEFNEGLNKENFHKDSNKNEPSEPLKTCSDLSLNSDVGLVPDSTYPPQEPGSQDLEVLKDKHTEGMVQELRLCLPIWVTRDLILDLLTKSGGNIVEAASEFYEYETEFHEQVNSTNPPTALIVTTPQSNSAVLSKSPVKCITHQGLKNFISQDKKLPSIKHSVKGTLTPKKRGSQSDRMSKKKVKPNSVRESAGSKQPAITKFFSKLVPNDSKVSKSETCIAEEHQVSENLLPSDAAEPYKEHLDQFLQVLNGSISRNDAASILERAKGDLNVALDTYCNRSDGCLDEKGDLPLCSSTVQTQNCDNNSSLDDEERTNISSSSVQGISTENATATLVLLPLEKYSPVEHACWRSGQPAPYLHLARTFDLVEGERGKLKATGILCNMFRSLLALSPQDVLPAVYLCTNKIAPDHANMELNIGGSLVTSALEDACGTNKTKIKEMYNTFGDLGDVAQLCRQTQTLLVPPCALTIQEVFSVLRKISFETGHGSTTRKKGLITKLMRSCREKEMKFLVRTLVRNLRIGAMMRTILPALAQAVVVHSSSLLHDGPPEALKEKLQCISAAVIEAYNVLPDLDMLIPSLLSKSVEFSSSTLSMIPGIPIKPMLARITNGISQALNLFQGRAFTCENKYDGQRAQIHKLNDGSLKVFSRNGDETTPKFPDLVNIIEESCKPDAITFIVDAEVVAVDRKNGCKLMSFQELSSRERGSKSSIVTVNSIKVDICVFIFDIMFANGERLLDFPLRERRKYLKNLFKEEKVGYFEYAKEITVEAEDAYISSQETLTRINSFFEDAFSSSCEGIMVKSLDVDAIYAASKRSDTWLKVKRDYLEGMNDSLDLVPIGAWHGNGRKAGWYSPFLMACCNPDTQEFQSVCRVMSGFSDSFYVEMKEYFSGEKILSKKPPYYQTNEVPDLWFSPELVWEIRGADFTISPVHHAAIGLVHPARGISIRFPRFIGSVSDRRVEDCSSAMDIADMFQSQNRKMDVSAGD